MVTLIADGRRIQANRGESVLHACLVNGIYIPNLCFLESESEPEASCRLCFVEIEGDPQPVAACTVPASRGLIVHTDSQRVRHLQRSALRLLLSVHDIDCRNCHANRACALQDMARFLNIGLKPKPLNPLPRPVEVDHSHPCIDLYPHRCVLCARCIKVCRNPEGRPALTFTGRGINTRVRYFPTEGDMTVDCHACARCVAVCPVGAIQLRRPGRIDLP